MPYSFRFSSNEPYRYVPGSLFIGTDPEDAYEVGIKTDRHAITIAGARTGKGAALIIPNLLRWQENALVIDPKGEAAEATAAARAAMGQEVHILDPFGVVTAPALQQYKARFNPLASINAAALDAREDIGVMADGLVMRNDPRASHWDGGGLSVIAGLIALICDTAPPGRRTLPELRSILTAPPEDFARVVDEMGRNGAFGNLPATAASKLTKSGSEAGHFLSVADENTKWLDSPAIGAMLADSSFNLADLKTKPCSVFLVLPAHLLGEHGRFLRLFVRLAINAMAKGGTKGGRRCLFFLDEFFSLGYLDEVAKSAGLMPGYGVHLWPILQDLGQLEKLYGRDGLHTFFGNSDAHIFFGNADAMTLDYVSQRAGRVGASELPPPPSADPFTGDPKTWRELFDSPEVLREKHRSAEENKMRQYQFESSGQGRDRLAPDQVREIVMKGDNDAVARSMIVFAKGSDILNVALAPYFVALPTPSPMRAAPTSRRLPLSGVALLIILGGLYFVVAMMLPFRWGLVGGLFGQVMFAILAAFGTLVLYRRKVPDPSTWSVRGFSRAAVRNWKWVLLLGIPALVIGDMIRQGHDLGFIAYTVFWLAFTIALLWGGYRLIRSIF